MSKAPGGFIHLYITIFQNASMVDNILMGWLSIKSDYIAYSNKNFVEEGS